MMWFQQTLGNNNILFSDGCSTPIKKKQKNSMPPIGIKSKLHKKWVENCLLNFGLELSSILLSDNIREILRFYIPICKVLEQPWRNFTSLELCKCSWIMHPLPRAASTTDRTTINQYWLYHLQTLQKFYHSFWIEAFHP